MGNAIVTRDPVAAQAYAEVLAPLGLDVVAMPVTRSAPAADPDALAHALEAGELAAIVVVSPRAADELARAVRASSMKNLPEIWAVGPATRRALELANLASHHPDDVLDGAGLARALLATRAVRGRRVLLPRAENGRTDACDLLRAAGVDVLDVLAYRTIAVDTDDPAIATGRELLRRGAVDVCAVFAPSQVHALGAVVGPLATLGVSFCAVGETTARALRGDGINDVAVATEPSPAGMAQAVRSVYPRR